MSDQEKKTMKFNTVLTVIGMLCAGAAAILGIMVKLQTDNIALTQDKALIQAKSDMGEKFLSKQDFNQQFFVITENQGRLAVNLNALTELVNHNYTEIQVLKSKTTNQKLTNKLP